MRRMRSLLAFTMVAAVVVVGGCGPKGPVEVSVKGQVMLDGKAMADGEVSFGLAGMPSVPLAVKDGAFEGKVKQGSNRVEVRAYRMGKQPMMGGQPVGEPSKENYIPARWNNDSTLTADVSPSNREFKFEVTSR